MKTFTNLIKRASLSTFNKKRYYLFIITMLLTLGVGNAWAEESFTIHDKFTSTTMAYATTYTADISVSDLNGGNSTVGISVLGVYKQTKAGTTFQTNKKSGHIKNTSAIPGKITKIVVSHNSSYQKNALKVYGAKGQEATTESTLIGTLGSQQTDETISFETGEYNYFLIDPSTGTGSAQMTSITIYYTSSSGSEGGDDPDTPGEGGGEDPNPDPEEPGTGTSGEVTFVFDTDQGLSELGITKPNAGAGTNLENNVYTKAPINMTATDGGTATRVWNSSGATTLRVYKSTGSLTFSSEATINKIVFNTSITATASVGTLSGTTWAGETKEVKFTFGANATIKTIAVSYVSSGGETPEPETPATELTNDQFAWSAATAEATMGATNTFPTLTNTVPVSVTYESSNTDAATIASDGSITLVAPGTTTISAKFAGGEVSGTTYAAKTVTYTLTVLKAPATPTSTVYVKVTNAVTDGEYLIVYETGNVAFNGALTDLDEAKNTVEVTINSNTIAGNTDIDAATFTIDATAKTLKSKSGYYIGQTLDANGLASHTTTTYEHTFSFANDGSANIVSKGAYLRYNSDANQLRFRYYKSSSYTNQKAIALYKKASSHTLTYGTCTNGSVSADVADGATVLSGTTITLSNTPATDYKLSAYDVYKTGDETTKVTVTNDKFVMPEFDVTISATFVAAKTLTSIEITTAATQTTFWQGETFNSTGLEVTAHFDGAAYEVVTPTVTGSTASAGTQTVTVSYTEGTVTESTSYEITVKAIPNTKETAYSVADAYDIIDKLTTATGVFITGTISQVDSYNSTYKSITYWISADGTTTNQLQVYSGKGLESADFTAVTDLTVGDQVIVCGNLKKHNSTYEFDYNNYLAAYTPTTKDPAGLVYATTEYTANVGEAFATPELTNPNGLTVTYSTSDASKATVDASTGAVTILAVGKVTITASTTGDDTHDAGTASYTITISNPAMAVATLPFAFDNGKADIENTPGMSQNGLGSDYGSAPLLKFDGTGDNVIIHFNGEPGKLSYDIKGNSYSDGTFTVQESADGDTYTELVTYTELGSTETKTHTLAAASRYVKFIYTEKVNGNVALGNINIALPGEEPEEPEQPGEGGGETALTDWVLTSAADITINDLVVITMTKGETTWAMTNDKGTSAAPAASVVTLSANALAAEPAANLKWVVSNDNGTLTIYPYGIYETWLYCTNTNNGVRVGTGDAKEFTINANYLYTSQTTDPRHIGVYNEQDWRCYKPSSGAVATNIADQTLAFYVKKNANDVLPGAGEDPEGGEGGEDPVVPTPTINPTATFIFNTAEGLNDLGIAYPTTEDEDNVGAYKTNLTDGASFTQDGITMTSTDGTTVTRVWLTAAGKLDLRVYKNATLTFSVPENLQIQTVAFDGNNINHLLVDGVAVSNNTWTGGKQEITFTAKADASTIKINTISFVIAYTRNVTNKFGTICLPYASASTTGATFYRVAGKETGKVYLESVNALEAGVPYIFEKTANQIKVVYTGDKETTPGSANGLIGNFTDETVVPTGNYILYNNAFIPADGTTNKVNAYRAYLDMDAVTGGVPQQMPGRRYIGMSVQGENETTGFDNIQLPNANSQKLIINGQLIIIRDGEMYNAQGVRF